MLLKIETHQYSSGWRFSQVLQIKTIQLIVLPGKDNSNGKKKKKNQISIICLKIFLVLLVRN